MNLLLRPLSLLYHCVTALRNYVYDKGLVSAYQCPLPVVSVGNLSVGGNGKTPLVLFLVEELVRRGFEPVVLSRGYGGKFSGPVRVCAEHTATEVGDEPLLVARKSGCPVVVARRRARGAKFIEDARLGNVIVLDDGFQHRRLARDLDILVSYVGNPEAKRDFIEGRLLPEGRFREARDHAFRRAGMLVFSERQPSEAAAAIDPALLRMVPAGIQIYRSFIEVQEARNLMDGKVLPPQSVVAVCGIAHPESFLATLRQADYAVSASYCFPDHSAFSDAEISGIKARHPGLPLVCTEKDAVRLTGSNRERVSELRIATKVIPGDAFITQICRVIRHRQQQAAGDVVGFHPKTRKMKLNE